MAETVLAAAQELGALSYPVGPNLSMKFSRSFSGFPGRSGRTSRSLKADEPHQPEPQRRGGELCCEFCRKVVLRKKSKREAGASPF